MKQLTKIRLINWHYFENETIPVKGNILLTGHNGAGKSTILDAISFVLTAGDTKFNLAANEKSKRDLRGYCKCKLGSTEQEYLRDYDLTTHICLEFYSDKQNKYFCIGAIVDVIGNVIPPKVYFYIIDEKEDDKFFITEENKVKSSADFRKEKYTEFIYQTKSEAKSAFRNKLGGISDRYFSLLPKALAFKPISDVKEYIYHQLLDEKQIDVKNIQESIRSYKEFEAILKQTKNKIEDLEKITNNYFAIKDIKDNQEFYNYLLIDLKRSDNLNKINKLMKDSSRADISLNNIRNAIKDLNDKISDNEDRSKEMYASLSQDKDFRASELYDKDINKANNLLKEEIEKVELFYKRVDDIKSLINVIKTFDTSFSQELSKLNFKIEDKDDIDKLEFKLKETSKLLDDKKNDCIQKLADLNIKKNEILLKIQDVYRSLNSLEKNDIPYRVEIVELRQRMEEYLYNIYKEHINVHILAEIIEVSDPTWHDTVENFLNQQRFTLIVEPRYYDDCLECYNQYKSGRIYGVNLLNTKKIQDFTSYQPNSLASIIETDNIDARCYINYLVGSLIMVSDVNELDKYSQSITREGMIYRGYTTRYLNPNTEKPFIGRKAKDEQKAKYIEIGEKLKTDFEAITNVIQNQNKVKDSLNDLDINELLDLLKSVKNKMNLELSIEELSEKKNHLKQTSVNNLRKEYEDLIEEIRKLNASKDQLSIDFGTTKNSISQIENEILELTNENSQITIELQETETLHLDFKKRTEDLFNNERENGKSTKEIESYYQKEIETMLSNLKSLENGLVVTQVNYIGKYNRPLQTGFDAMPSYLEEQEKLVKSELVKYESKVRDSRVEAEKLFKEDFLSKLRSYILEAQDEISKINETLDKIKFGNDKYQFVFLKSKEFGAIYEMVVNDIDSKNSYSVFNEEFERKYNQELDELFTNLAMDEENSHGNLNKYTDYRTYMDYDIKITSLEDTFYFSAISKEKSGGETQIPFYVAILASFVRLFDKAEKSGLDDSVGLIYFDEVFDKMDNTRIEAMMQFINSLNVQIIFACPQQKIDTIGKNTDTTIAVFRNGKQAQAFVTASK